LADTQTLDRNLAIWRAHHRTSDETVDLVQKNDRVLGRCRSQRPRRRSVPDRTIGAWNREAKEVRGVAQAGDHDLDLESCGLGHTFDERALCGARGADDSHRLAPVVARSGGKEGGMDDCGVH